MCNRAIISKLAEYQRMKKKLGVNLKEDQSYKRIYNLVGTLTFGAVFLSTAVAYPFELIYR